MFKVVRNGDVLFGRVDRVGVVFETVGGRGVGCVKEFERHVGVWGFGGGDGNGGNGGRPED